MTIASDASAHQHPARLVVVFDPRTPNTLQFARLCAGNAWQIIWLVDTAKFDLGSTVQLLARNGLVVDAAGLEPDAIAALLAPLHPTGIVTFVDSELVRTAQIARAAGLSFHAPDVALRLTNKVAQREAFAAAGLVVPRYWALSAGADAQTHGPRG